MTGFTDRMSKSFKEMAPADIFKSLATEPGAGTYRTRQQIIESVAVYAHRNELAQCGKLVSVLTEMVEYFERGGQGNSLPSERHITERRPLRKD